MSWRILEGDCRARLADLEPESVQCVVTSPPYWGLRDYGTPGQIGLEPTPKEYVATMVDVFREVRRALRKDGTLWLNMGDSYASGTAGARLPSQTGKHGYWQNPAIDRRLDPPGLAAKQLIGIPWRVAFALQADGWWLRSDVIWAKPNPMPESVTDRPTRAHEFVFLLTRSARYFYDAEAVREIALWPDGPNAPDKIASPYGQGFTRRNTFARDGAVADHVIPGQTAPQHRSDRTDYVPPGRNLRSAVRRAAKEVAAEIGDEERVARICAGVLRDLDELAKATGEER